MTIRTLTLIAVLLGTAAAAQSAPPLPPPVGPTDVPNDVAKDVAKDGTKDVAKDGTKDVAKKERPRNVLYTGPVALLFQHWHFEYERVLAPNVSAYLIPTLINRSGTGTGLSTRERIYGADFGARFFPGNEAPEGFFVAALLSAFHSTYTYTDPDDNVTLSGPLFNLGVQVGYTAVVGDALAISFGIGAGYGLTPVRPVPVTLELGAVDSTPMPLGLPWSSINLNSRLSVGYAF